MDSRTSELRLEQLPWEPSLLEHLQVLALVALSELPPEQVLVLYFAGLVKQSELL
jgi:hypothetical protein